MQLAWLAAEGAAADVYLPAAADPVLRLLPDLHPRLRRSALAVLPLQPGRRPQGRQGEGMVALPYDLDVPLLVYRRDALAAVGLGVPQTWAELVAAARALSSPEHQQRTCQPHSSSSNGTGGEAARPAACYPHSFCLLLPPGCGYDGVALAAVWASMGAVRGPAAGLYFDTERARPRLGGAAMVEAVRLLRELLQYGPRGLGPCGRLDFETARSSCALGIATSSAARLFGMQQPLAAGLQVGSEPAGGNGAAGAGSSTAGVWQGPPRGTAGISLLPGSSAVEDPLTGQLRLCARGGVAPSSGQSVECPYAEPHADPARAAQGVVVNRAPHPGRGPFYLALNRSAHPAAQLTAWRQVVWALSPGASLDRLADPGVFASPVRRSELSGRTSLSRLVAAGWHPGDASQYLTALSSALGHRNAVPPARFLGAEVLHRLLGRAAQTAQQAGGAAGRAMVPEEVVQALVASLSAAFPDGLSTVVASYMHSIGALPGSLLLPPVVQPNEPRPAERQAAGLTRSERVGLGVGVAGGTLLLLAAALLLLLYGRNAGLRAGWRGKRGAGAIPGIGPQTTLVITDIMDSTQLWEALPAAVMDVSLDLHNRCVRQLVARLRGYECHTEGDSFTLAFFHAADATAFALELQVGLMDLEWPAELLEHPSACEVFLTTKAEAAAAAALQAQAHAQPPQTPPAGSPGAAAGGPLLLRTTSNASSSRHTPTSVRLAPHAALLLPQDSVGGLSRSGTMSGAGRYRVEGAEGDSGSPCAATSRPRGPCPPPLRNPSSLALAGPQGTFASGGGSGIPAASPVWSPGGGALSARASGSGSGLLGRTTSMPATGSRHSRLSGPCQPLRGPGLQAQSKGPEGVGVPQQGAPSQASPARGSPLHLRAASHSVLHTHISYPSSPLLQPSQAMPTTPTSGPHAALPPQPAQFACSSGRRRSAPHGVATLWQPAFGIAGPPASSDAGVAPRCSNGMGRRVSLNGSLGGAGELQALTPGSAQPLAAALGRSMSRFAMGAAQQQGSRSLGQHMAYMPAAPPGAGGDAGVAQEHALLAGALHAGGPLHPGEDAASDHASLAGPEDAGWDAAAPRASLAARRGAGPLPALRLSPEVRPASLPPRPAPRMSAPGGPSPVRAGAAPLRAHAARASPLAAGSPVPSRQLLLAGYKSSDGSDSSTGAARQQRSATSLGLAGGEHGAAALHPAPGPPLAGSTGWARGGRGTPSWGSPQHSRSRAISADGTAREVGSPEAGRRGQPQHAAGAEGAAREAQRSGAAVPPGAQGGACSGVPVCVGAYLDAFASTPLPLLPEGQPLVALEARQAGGGMRPAPLLAQAPSAATWRAGLQCGQAVSVTGWAASGTGEALSGTHPASMPPSGERETLSASSHFLSSAHAVPPAVPAAAAAHAAAQRGWGGPRPGPAGAPGGAAGAGQEQAPKGPGSGASAAGKAPGRLSVRGLQRRLSDNLSQARLALLGGFGAAPPAPEAAAAGSSQHRAGPSRATPPARAPSPHVFHAHPDLASPPGWASRPPAGRGASLTAPGMTDMAGPVVEEDEEELALSTSLADIVPSTSGNAVEQAARDELLEAAARAPQVPPRAQSRNSPAGDARRAPAMALLSPTHEAAPGEHIPERTSRGPRGWGFWKQNTKVARSFAAALLHETLRAASSQALGPAGAADGVAPEQEAHAGGVVQPEHPPRHAPQPGWAHGRAAPERASLPATGPFARRSKSYIPPPSRHPLQPHAVGGPAEEPPCAARAASLLASRSRQAPLRSPERRSGWGPAAKPPPLSAPHEPTQREAAEEPAPPSPLGLAWAGGGQPDDAHERATREVVVVDAEELGEGGSCAEGLISDVQRRRAALALAPSEQLPGQAQGEAGPEPAPSPLAASPHSLQHRLRLSPAALYEADARAGRRRRGVWAWLVGALGLQHGEDPGAGALSVHAPSAPRARSVQSLSPRAAAGAGWVGAEASGSELAPSVGPARSRAPSAMLDRIRAHPRSRRRLSTAAGLVVLGGRAEQAGQVLLFRGMRVRVGLHTGLDPSCDVYWTKRSGRAAYSGPAMRTARLLSDAALGGMVVLSAAVLGALRPLPSERLPPGTMVWHSGRYRLADREGWADEDVFQALLPALLPRVQAHRGQPLRVTASLQPGLLDAPVGPVAVAGCTVVGVDTLRSWDPAAAEAALGMFRWQAAAVAAEHGGVLVECEEGAAVAAFTEPHAAVAWCLSLEDDLKTAVPWPAELLRHELGEEVSCVLPGGAAGAEGLLVTQLVAYGLRVRCAAEWFPDVRPDTAVTHASQLYAAASGGKPWRALQRLLRLARAGSTLISGSLHRLLLRHGGPLLPLIATEPLLPPARGRGSAAQAAAEPRPAGAAEAHASQSGAAAAGGASHSGLLPRVGGGSGSAALDRQASDPLQPQPEAVSGRLADGRAKLLTSPRPPAKPKRPSSVELPLSWAARWMLAGGSQRGSGAEDAGDVAPADDEAPSGSLLLVRASALAAARVSVPRRVGELPLDPGMLARALLSNGALEDVGEEEDDRGSGLQLGVGLGLGGGGGSGGGGRADGLAAERLSAAVPPEVLQREEPDGWGEAQPCSPTGRAPPQLPAATLGALPRARSAADHSPGAERAVAMVLGSRSSGQVWGRVGAAAAGTAAGGRPGGGSAAARTVTTDAGVSGTGTASTSASQSDVSDHEAWARRISAQQQQQQLPSDAVRVSSMDSSGGARRSFLRAAAAEAHAVRAAALLAPPPGGWAGGSPPASASGSGAAAGAGPFAFQGRSGWSGSSAGGLGGAAGGGPGGPVRRVSHHGAPGGMSRSRLGMQSPQLLPELAPPPCAAPGGEREPGPGVDGQAPAAGGRAEAPAVTAAGAAGAGAGAGAAGADAGTALPSITGMVVLGDPHGHSEDDPCSLTPSLGPEGEGQGAAAALGAAAQLSGASAGEDGGPGRAAAPEPPGSPPSAFACAAEAAARAAAASPSPQPSSLRAARRAVWSQPGHHGAAPGPPADPLPRPPQLHLAPAEPLPAAAVPQAAAAAPSCLPLPPGSRAADVEQPRAPCGPARGPLRLRPDAPLLPRELSGVRTGSGAVPSPLHTPSGTPHFTTSPGCIGTPTTTAPHSPAATHHAVTLSGMLQPAGGASGQGQAQGHTDASGACVHGLLVGTGGLEAAVAWQGPPAAVRAMRASAAGGGEGEAAGRRRVPTWGLPGSGPFALPPPPWSAGAGQTTGNAHVFILAATAGGPGTAGCVPRRLALGLTGSELILLSTGAPAAALAVKGLPGSSPHALACRPASGTRLGTWTQLSFTPLAPDAAAVDPAGCPDSAAGRWQGLAPRGAQSQLPPPQQQQRQQQLPAHPSAGEAAEVEASRITPPAAVDAHAAARSSTSASLPPLHWSYPPTLHLLASPAVAGSGSGAGAVAGAGADTPGGAELGQEHGHGNASATLRMLPSVAPPAAAPAGGPGRSERPSRRSLTLSTRLLLSPEADRDRAAVYVVRWRYEVQHPAAARGAAVRE